MIQYYVEKEGIPTISISHLPNLTEKIRVPRALQIRFPLGRSFGQAYENELQKEILLQLIHYLSLINEPETIVKLPYKWKRKKK